jgi:hypothetical protein
MFENLHSKALRLRLRRGGKRAASPFPATILVVGIRSKALNLLLVRATSPQGALIRRVEPARQVPGGRFCLCPDNQQILFDLSGFDSLCRSMLPLLADCKAPARFHQRARSFSLVSKPQNDSPFSELRPTPRNQTSVVPPRIDRCRNCRQFIVLAKQDCGQIAADFVRPRCLHIAENDDASLVVGITPDGA